MIKAGVIESFGEYFKEAKNKKAIIDFVKKQMGSDSPKTKKAAKLKQAAQTTAYCGFSTRVETMVAIEFAASCSPFMKSKASATTISSTSVMVRPMVPAPAQTCSMTMSLITCATSSKRSHTFSRWS